MPSKQITFVHALQKMDDKKISQSRVVFEEKGNLLDIKGTNKKEKLKTTCLLLCEAFERWLSGKWC
jgi:hypothetical protein